MRDYFHPFVLFFVIGVVSLFGTTLFKFVRWYRQFNDEQKAVLLKNIMSFRFLKAIGEMFMECLLHRRVTRYNRVLGYMHRSIAFGWFLLIVVGFIETNSTVGLHHPVWAAIFYRFFFHGHAMTPYATFFANLMDALLLYVLSGVTLAFIKSMWSRIVGMKKTTRHVAMDQFAKYSLWFIFPLRLLSECFAATLYHNGGFVTQTIGNVFSVPVAQTLLVPSWTLYSLALGIFFVCMPFSRYMHIFTEVPLIFFRRLGIHEQEHKTGYTMYELSACSRCGVCIDKCPLNAELEINNVQSVYFLRDIRYKRVRRRIADNCLLCGQCDAVCPVGLDLMNIRRQQRDKKHLDTTGNYAYLDKVRPFNAIGRVAYFGGCMSHLTPGITESMKHIFSAAGQRYWHMDEEGGICCGRPLYQQGYNRQAAALRAKNTQLIEESGASLLITSCPICYQSFTREYQLKIPVMHHTEYIDMLIREGRISVSQSQTRVSYHDPCELGRGCGIYDAPRAILNATSHLLQTPKEREFSLCCGHTLGDTAISIEQQARIRDAARDNLLSVEPDLIATACPMCKRSFKTEMDVAVKDVAEIVAEQLA